MKIIVIPLILTITPALVLFIFLKYRKRNKTVSKSLKVLLGILFVTISLAATLYATMISINGIAARGVRCATGATTFLYLGFALSFGYIPSLLLSPERPKKPG